MVHDDATARDEAREHLENARRPSSTPEGRSFLDTMNHGHHAELSAWGLPHLRLEPGFACLDVGCGGGANVARLLEHCPEGRVLGVDYSPASVDFASEVNAEAIAEGRCCILPGDVAELPFSDRSFNVATAFETVYFWPEPARAFAEVLRVLKPGGSFLVCNEADGSSPKSDVWDDVAGHMKIYAPDEIEALMKASGFEVSSVDRVPEKGWVAVVGTRPEE